MSSKTLHAAAERFLTPPRAEHGAPLADVARATDALLGCFVEAGYAPIEPPMLVRADSLFELYGEEIWERAYVVEDLDQGDWCLRPDFTAPVARSHVDRAGGAGGALYAYSGPVFRKPLRDDGAPGARGGVDAAQQLQVGLEAIDAEDGPGREVGVFLLCREALGRAGVADFDVLTGDLGVIFALLEAITMPESWRHRLKRHFWRPERFREMLRGFGRPTSAGAASAHASFLGALKELPPAQAASAVAEMIAMTETPAVGVRRPAEVAERLLARARDAVEPPLSTEILALLDAALAVSGPSDASLARFGDLAAGAGLDLDAPLARMSARLDAFAAAGIAPESLAFDADFGRNLEYYDGFVFELHGAATDAAGRYKLGGGGRYDRLLRALGASGLAGMGAALRPEAIAAVVEGAR